MFLNRKALTTNVLIRLDSVVMVTLESLQLFSWKLNCGVIMKFMKEVVIVWNCSEKCLMSFEIKCEKEFHKGPLVGFIFRKVPAINIQVERLDFEQ